MSRITFDGREVQAIHVDKLAGESRRLTQPLTASQAVEFANPAGDAYVAFVVPGQAMRLRPGTAGLYEHDGVAEDVIVTAVAKANRGAGGAVMVSTGVFTVLLGALAGTLIEPGAGTALGAAAALLGTIGVGMPLTVLMGALGQDKVSDT